MTPRRVLALASVGVLAGFFSGMFGVGGGIAIIPLLVIALHYQPRLASGTSLTAILPITVVGGLGYSVAGNVDWVIAGCLAVGAVVGSFFGTQVLVRIGQHWVQGGFIVFQVVMAVVLFLTAPERDAEVGYSVPLLAVVVLIGFITGGLSGLFGIGGGVTIVPLMMLIVGMGDLAARGTSLVMMIPTAIVGTLNNLRNGNADVPAAVLIGCSAVPASLGGVAVAGLISPQLSNVLFAALIVVSATQLTIKAWRQRGSA
ncbi:sulfite exporter TauE/SafE family protein [Salinibacterium sp. GXW1014]|uniref:sulfite exporter TauE/SafE family protein n=1 Tax=Salinibacterium sp. GXW1014 TaxID=3377838 RepID=UPI00383AC2F6